MSLVQHLFHLLLGIVALIFIAEPAWIPAVAQHFLKAVGEACVIALLVIYLVELHSHKRLEKTATEMIRKVGKNIFGLVYGHELPSAFVDLLEATTLEKPIYREKIHLNYEIQALQVARVDGAIEDICVLRSTHHFNLVNCSDEDVDHNVRIYLERDIWLAEIVAENATDPKFEYVRIDNTVYTE